MATTGIQISGLNQTVRSLSKFGVEVQDLKAVFRKVSDRVVNDAKSNVDSRSGRLAGSIRAGNSKNKAIVRAGSARVPYAGVQEYGGYNNITPMEFLQRAAADNKNASVKAVDEGLGALIRKHGLK